MAFSSASSKVDALECTSKVATWLTVEAFLFISSTSVSAILASSSIISSVLFGNRMSPCQLALQVSGHDEGVRNRRNFVTLPKGIDALDGVASDKHLKMHSQ